MTQTERFFWRESDFPEVLRAVPTCGNLERNFTEALSGAKIAGDGSIVKDRVLVAAFYTGHIHDPSEWAKVEDGSSSPVLIKYPRIESLPREYGFRNGIVRIGQLMFAADVGSGVFKITRPIRKKYQAALMDVYEQALSFVNIASLPVWDFR